MRRDRAVGLAERFARLDDPKTGLALTYDGVHSNATGNALPADYISQGIDTALETVQHR